MTEDEIVIWITKHPIIIWLAVMLTIIFFIIMGVFEPTPPGEGGWM